MARKPMMAGNWKMNNTIAEAVVLAQEISNHYEKEWPEHVDVVVCPPYVDLKPVKTVFDFDKAKVSVAAQNVYWEPAGAFTGASSMFAGRLSTSPFLSVYSLSAFSRTSFSISAKRSGCASR